MSSISSINASASSYLGRRGEKERKKERTTR
jgi:hypothetical protein